MAEQFQEVLAPAEKPNVPTRGIEALAQAGRRLGALGTEQADAIRKGSEALTKGFQGIDTGLQEVARIREQHDVTEDVVGGNAARAAGHNFLTQSWPQYQKDHAGDPNMAANFQHDVVEPTLDNLNNGAQTDAGRRHMSEQVTRLSEQWNDKLVNQQAQITGAQAQINFDAAQRNWSQAAITDPAALNHSIEGSRESAKAVAALMPPERGAEFIRQNELHVQQMTEAAFRTQLQKDPNFDPEPFFQAHAKDLGGPAIEQMRADQIHAQKAAQANDRANQTRAETIAVDTAKGNFGSVYVTIHQPDGSLVPQEDSIKILNDYYLSLPLEVRGKVTAEYERAVNLVHAAHENKNVVDDPTTIARLNSVLYDPQHPLTPQQVDDEFVHKRLSEDSYKAYRQYAVDASAPVNKATNEAITSARNIAVQYLNPKTFDPANPASSVVGKNDWGPLAVSMFDTRFNQGIAAARAGGYLDSYLAPTGPQSWTNSIFLPDIIKTAKDQYTSLGNRTAGEPIGPTPTVTIGPPEIRNSEEPSAIGKFFHGLFGGK